MVVADLHVHTTNSDGTLTIETLASAAHAADLDAVAVTDHDRPHPEIEEGISELDGVTLVHGIELRVETPEQRLDLLGYGLARTTELTALTDRLQRNRIERAREIVDCVEDRLGIPLDIAYDRGVGRPHVARAIAASSAPYDYSDAFAELIGDDCACYVSREIPDFETGRAVLADACDVVGLAHPFRYDDPARALEYTEHLDAVEIPYPYDRAVDTTAAEEAASEFDLLVTGGSDAHDDQLGNAGLDGGQYEQFLSALK
ncbi:PHP domain-containing protein [Halobacteriaceae archaeon SHR40]|uniref:PHP domain-containing protein n=1 Tax=Halovenus amylolytica TaxID=2500550 RepID=UPI000FE2DEDA